MIDSPTTQFSDVKLLLRCTSTSSYVKQTDEEKIAIKTRHIVHTSSIYTYFLRISWSNKLNLLKNLAQSMTFDSISLLLQTLHPIIGKITSYAATSTKSNIPYDTVLNDHDRMCSEHFLEETMSYDLDWFKNLDEKDQVALFVGLLRLGGGVIMHRLYKCLQDLHATHLQKMATTVKPANRKSKEESMHLISTDEQNTSCPLFPEFAHDLNDPNHIECVRLTKKWEAMIGNYRNEVEKAAGKKQKSKTDIKDKKKKGKNTKKAKEKADSSIDWIQIMPIGIVKKIFSYLDKKSLIKAKKVNEYWKWVVGDLLKDLKVKKALDKTKKNILADLNESRCPLPDDPFFTEDRPRKSWTDRRFDKLFQRGAILEKLRHITTAPLEEHSLLIKALQSIPFTVDHLDEVTMLPVIKRTNPPLFQVPEYLLKDYKVICEVMPITESAQEVPTGHHDLSSVYSSLSSDEIEF